MSSTKVRNYTTEELINRVKSLSSFKKMPTEYWIIGIRSEEDTYNTFDDKFYLFNKKEFIMVLPGTTNSGGKGLLSFLNWNKKGVAVIKSEEIYYNVYEKSDGVHVRHHNGKMECLRQVGPMFYYRDGDKNKTIDEVGEVTFANNGTNLHANSYEFKAGIRSWLIGGWSVGCNVINDLTKYYQMLGLMPLKEKITFVLLKEF
jgi:hypothetical protein